MGAASVIMPIIEIEGVRYEVDIVFKGSELVTDCKKRKEKHRFGYYKLGKGGLTTGPINNDDILVMVKKN